MSALHDALLHPNNRPRPLCEWLAGSVNSGAELRGLTDGGGLICDFRPGFEEHNPSLSVSVGSGGTVFNRHGGDRIGGALDFTASCLNVGKGEAARLLIERAGIVDTGPGDGTRPTVKASKGAASLLTRLGKLKPLDEVEGTKRLRGWVQLTGEDEGPELGELARRGLSVALTSGLLTAYAWTGREHTDPTKPGKVFSLPGHILPGAVLFEVTGPDAQPWAFKVRNPGEKSELEAVKATRYVYLGKGQGTPAWCSPGLTEAQSEVWVEGELSGVAVAVMLEAAGYGGAVGVQGVAGSETLPHVSHLTAGREVYIYADRDAAGEKARKTWAELAAHLGAKVYQLPAGLFGAGDACDVLPTLSAAELGAQVIQAMQDAPQMARAEPTREDGDVWTSKRSGFGLRGGVLCALSVKKDEETGEDRESAEPLCNFAAFITAEVTEEDGTGEAARTFELEGHRSGGQPMRPARIRVTAAEFGGMNWAVREWGARAIVVNGQGKKDKAREAIQRLSEQRGFEERTVYTHTGWLEHPEHGHVYLSAGAVIGAAGAVAGVDVDLGAGLNAYALPDPAEGDLPGAVRASLALLELAPDAVAVPVLGAAYRAALGRSDFAVWPVGETGRHKTALMGPVQSHYGKGWNRHRLPEGWNSTANALEAAAHAVKDALLVIDDFKPGGSQTDVNRMHGNLTRTLQGVADGAGRGRMGITGKRQTGKFPRGTVMSSSETLPRGHSNRARVVVVDVPRKLIDSPAKSEAFHAAEDLAGQGVYALALAGYVRFIAQHYSAVVVGSPAHRAFTRSLAPRFEGAHGRTGPAAAELAYGWACFLTFAVDLGAVTEDRAGELWARVVAALEDTSTAQGEHLRDADPVDAALSVLSGLLAQGRVFLEDAAKEEAGPPPDDVAPLLGWQAKTWHTEHSEGVELKTRHGAELLGYYSKSGGDEWAYFLPDALHAALQRAVSGQAGSALPDASTLYSNMKDRFHGRGLMRCEVENGGEGKPGRVRPYYKATVRGQRLRFVALRLPINLDSYNVGTVGTMGTDGEGRASGTVPSAVPSFNIFREVLGTMGTPSLKRPVSSPSPSPLRLTLDDLADTLEGEELPGVVSL
ncbi:DUF927 domain-containing protein [Deinococcus sp.]|uniref:DUF927 domain-containing protein n=1 Tax=Deinococcus sp. TaxID=47478 RepID=UPI0025EDCC50|nr:DUF927 domain-containing protein [Deinococcus sp.]